MGRLTTHVLDTSLGRPAAGLTIELWTAEAEPALLRKAVTNEDGRVDGALLEGADFRTGAYELHFHAGAYHRRHGAAITDPPFLDIVPIRFGISDENAHYHVPLLLSPYGYSTYRGS